MSDLFFPRLLRAPGFRVSLIVTAALVAALLLVACDRDPNSGVNDAEDTLAALQEEEVAAGVALRKAEEAAEACDPEAAAAALAEARAAAVAVAQNGPSALATAQGTVSRVAGDARLSASAASLLASIEALIANMPGLVGQTERAAALAQQRLDDGACGDADEDDDGAGSTDSDEGEFLFFLRVLVINGEEFPGKQFHEANPDACDDYHYHVAQAVSLAGVLAFDPEPGGCGFGKVSEVVVDVIRVSQEVIDDWEQAVAGQ